MHSECWLLQVVEGKKKSSMLQILAGRLLRNCMQDQRIDLISRLARSVVFVPPVYLEFVAYSCLVF